LTKESKRHILNALKIGLIVNILLAGLKLTFGMIGNAQALFSDGLNSLSDVLISVMLLFFMKIATQKPDEDHPYGHEKYEGLAYFALGIIFSLSRSTLVFKRFMQSSTSFVMVHLLLNRALLQSLFHPSLW
jgi:divalent metal cation (Fe/Co/Zn/Cd) transporter